MTKNTCMAIAQEFYKAMGEKNLEALKKHVHPDVHFIAPLAEVRGKDAYLEILEKFMNFFKSLTLRAAFGSENEGVVIYDLEFLNPIGHLSSAALLTFQKELIAKIELFYDARPFEK